MVKSVNGFKKGEFRQNDSIPNIKQIQKYDEVSLKFLIYLSKLV